MFKALLQDRFLDHPIHPMVVHLPIGFWVTSVICDIAYFASGNASLAYAAWLTTLLGLIGGIVAAVAGVLELQFLPKTREVRQVAYTHLGLNVVVMALYVVNYVVRNHVGGGAHANVPVIAFALNLIAVSVLMVSGYFGGKLVYVYGMGQNVKARQPGGTTDRPGLRRVA